MGVEMFLKLKEIWPFEPKSHPILISIEDVSSISQSLVNRGYDLEYVKCSKISMKNGKDFYIEESTDQIEKKINKFTQNDR